MLRFTLFLYIFINILLFSPQWHVVLADFEVSSANIAGVIEAEPTSAEALTESGAVNCDGDSSTVCSRSQTTDTKPPFRRLLVIITPTYSRLVQKPELIKQMHTLKLVPEPIHWIVIEDAESPSRRVQKLLGESGIRHTLLAVSTTKAKTPGSMVKGAFQRNLGIAYLRQSPEFNNRTGSVFFADDDNTYSLELFQEMRKMTGKVAVWPVGLAGGLIVERAYVNRTTNKVIGWNAVAHANRAFPLDMAAFAVDLQFMRSSNAFFLPTSGKGLLESDFVQALGVKTSDLQPLADACTKVLVWHTRMDLVSLRNEQKLNSKRKFSYAGTDAWV